MKLLLACYSFGFALILCYAQDNNQTADIITVNNKTENLPPGPDTSTVEPTPTTTKQSTTSSTTTIPTPTNITTTPSSTTSSTTSKSTTTSTTVSTTAKPIPIPTTSTPSTTPNPGSNNRKFDGPSFVGGIVLASGLVAIGFVAFKIYKTRSGNYLTL